jgi:putative endonuclease
MTEYAYVYILANGFKKLYIGITTDLMQRVLQHRNQKDPESHTARYNNPQSRLLRNLHQHPRGHQA